MSAPDTQGTNAQNDTDESPPGWTRKSNRSWRHVDANYLVVEIHKTEHGLSAAEFNAGVTNRGGRFRVVVRDEEPPSTPEPIWEGNAQSDETPRGHARDWMREHPEGI